MNKQQLNQIYFMDEQEQISADSYYLNRLTSLWGEEYLDLDKDKINYV
ncbi:MAG: hypothetical protein QNJ64_02095 [Crocosphaera sp.]|nr:hypothetical protein [Crocosphaera sp.]